jgi:SAM-dependent methyltransferase
LLADRIWAPLRSEIAHLVRGYVCVPLRRSIASGNKPWITDRLSESTRKRLDLDGSAVEPLRVELGCGPFPTPGYVHVDVDRRARHVEYVSPVWDLPFEDESVEKVLAIHVFEHVEPNKVEETLREWWRILKPGGLVQVHVPNAAAAFKAYLEGSNEQRWALIGYLYGMYCGPDVARPSDLVHRADHQAAYDFELIRSVLAEAGFSSIEDISSRVDDRHSVAWNRISGGLSLIVHAQKVRDPTGHHVAKVTA